MQFAIKNLLGVKNITYYGLDSQVICFSFFILFLVTEPFFHFYCHIVPMPKESIFIIVILFLFFAGVFCLFGHHKP